MRHLEDELIGKLHQFRIYFENDQKETRIIFKMTQIRTEDDLQSSVKAPWDGDTLGWASRVGESGLQRLDCTLRLLQLLH